MLSASTHASKVAELTHEIARIAQLVYGLHSGARLIADMAPVGQHASLSQPRLEALADALCIYANRIDALYREVQSMAVQAGTVARERA